VAPVIRLDPSLLTVQWNGDSHKLRPKTFAVLGYLLEHRSRTVAKQEILQAVWGEVNVTDDVLVQSITELRKLLEIDRSQPQILVTVPKLGYRLLAEPAADAAEPAPPQPKAPTRRTPALAIAAVTAAVLLTGASFWARSIPKSTTQSVIVLPLDNLSGSKELDWLREGLADMLITGLSQSPDLAVLSLEEVRARSGRSQASKPQGVVVKGTFASVGNQLRVDVQLIDGPTGRVLGGETLAVASIDQVLTRIDGLTAGVAGRLGVSGGASLSATNNLEAYRLYALGLDKAATFRNREAIDLFQRAVQLDPDFAMAHARTGYAYAVTWNLAPEARPHLERAYKLSHRLTPKDRKFIEGWYAIANLDFPRAVQVFRDIVRIYPGESEAFIRLGLLLRGEDRLDEALKVAQEGLAAHPGEAEFHDLEAGILAQLGRHDEAIAAARRYVERVPGESEAHDLLGEIYQWAGRAPEAEASYRKAQELAPGFERPVVHLGNLYFQLGRYKDAIRQYEHYIEIAPSELEKGRGWGRIAWVWWRLGDLGKASAAAAKELSMVPTAVWNSIVLALARGDAAEVARLRPRMDTVAFTSRGARTGQRYREYFEGYIALKQGRPEEALARFRKAVHQHAAPYWSMEAYEDCLADALLELGRHEEAVTEYRRALARNPGNAIARYHFAQALDRLGRREESQQEYRRFAEMWKSADPEIPELRNLPN